MTRVFDGYKTSHYAKYLTSTFNSMPEKAKQLYFSLMGEAPMILKKDFTQFYETYEINNAQCKSPIEHILCVAMDFAFHLYNLNHRVKYSVFPQEQINANGHTYNVDFLITGTIWTKNSDEPEVEIDNIVIECDGHEFHNKTKTQVKRDNEREYNLKMAGYDILRFSGSQIYNDPMKCANDIFRYMEEKLITALKSKGGGK